MYPILILRNSCGKLRGQRRYPTILFVSLRFTFWHYVSDQVFIAYLFLYMCSVGHFLEKKKILFIVY